MTTLGMSKMPTKKSFLVFNLSGVSKSGKTQLWDVISKDHILLGMISWHGVWRKYCFNPCSFTIYDCRCLREIADFCEGQTRLLRRVGKCSTNNESW